MPGAVLNGAISTYNLKQTASNEGILPMLIEQMINGNFIISVHRGEPASILPRQRREGTSRDAAGTLASWQFRETGRSKHPESREMDQRKGNVITGK